MKKAFWATLLIGLILTSCKNFLDAGDIKDEIEKAITYNNAKSFPLIISQDTTMGSFLSSGEKECKLNYSITVQFNLKKEAYIFKGVKAVKASDPDQSMDDYIEFQITDRDDQKGIYKISIKLIKESDEILILPDCKVIPNIIKEECKPEYKESGVEQDSTIEIALNTSIKTIEFFSPLITDSYGKSLEDYFENPYLSSDGKTIYIPTNKINKLLNTDGNAETKDILIKIDLSEIADEEGNTGSGTFQYKYRINQTRDTTKPVLVPSSTVLYFNSSKLEEIQKKEPANWSDSDYDLYHIKDTVYIEAEASDEGSGIRGFFVKETVLYLPDGTQPDNPPNEVHEKCNKDEKTGKYCTTYKINTLYDGIIELEFFAEDASDNQSLDSKKIYILKDKTIDAGSIKFEQEIGGFPNTKDAWLNAIPIVEGDEQRVELTLNPRIRDVYFSTNTKEYSSPYDIQVFWGYTEDDIKTKVTKNIDGKYIFTRDVNKMVFIKLICRDSLGNEKQIIKRMDPRADFLEVTGIRFDMNISNIDLLLSLCHITEEQFYDQYKYSRYIYEFTDPTDSENPFTSISIPNQYYTSGIVSALKAYSTQYEKPLPLYDMKIYMSTNIGDFPSPRSLSYAACSIDQWSLGGSNEEAELEGYSPCVYNDTVTLVFPGPASNLETEEITDINSNEEDTPYGPAGTPYIKAVLNITAKPMKNAGVYQVTIDDYMTEAGKNAGIIYTFFALPYEPQELPEGQEPPEGQDDLSGSFKAHIQEIKQSKTAELYLKSPGYYKLYITAYDPETNKKYRPMRFPDDELIPASETETTGMSFRLNNQTTISKNLELSEDLTPPIIHDATDIFYLPGSYKIWAPNDGYVESGLIVDNNNKVTLTYYIIPNPGNNVNFVPSYTVNELETQYSGYRKTIKYSPEGFSSSYDSSIQIPYGNLSGGFYTVSFVLKDRNNNEAVITRPFINNIIGELPCTIEPAFDEMTQQRCNRYTILQDDEANPEIQSLTIDGRQVPSINAQLQYLMGSEGTFYWQESGYDLCRSTTSNPNPPVGIPESTTVSFEHTIPNETVFPWSRIVAYYGFNDNESVIGKGFYQIKYVYTGTTDNTCSSKNCMEAMNGYQVFSDKPVFVHTMYCADKLTETTQEENACAIWENKGVEAGPAVIGGITSDYNLNSQSMEYRATGDGTYTYSRFSNIPSGAWYTTIFHFADGDVVMTDIKQKK